MLIRVGLILILLSLIPWKSEAAVMSIDLGSEWVKVAIVNLKPGQIPISVAINEMSKRKSPNLIAFHSDTRLIGEEAAGLVARYPDKVYALFRDLVSKPYDYATKFTNSFFLPYRIVEDSRGVAAIKVDGGEVYSLEELLAMLFRYALDLAEFHAKVKVVDAVVTVPPYFGQAERKAVLQAAQLGGVNVLSLINEHAGAALQYGIDKKFVNDSKYVVFYDMGATTTYAALVYFSAYDTKEFGKTVSANQFQVRDVRWNSELGGQNMEMRLVEYFADEFNKQMGNGVDVRKFPKSMAKLKKQVKRTKEILSANTAAPISVESIYEERDFRSSISREKFEELCGDLWEKALIPLKEVFQSSALKADDVYAVELIGGATRVPKLQAKLQEFLGRKELDKHLDADEAIVLGAALHAANISDGIKLNRKLGMIDGSTYGYVMELDGAGLVKDETTKQVLVPRMKKVPSKMFRSIVHDKDFEVSLSYENTDSLPPGVSPPIFLQYGVTGLANATERYSARNLSAPIKANLHFSLSRSGVLTLDRAEAVVEISEWVEVPKKILSVENSTTVNVTLEASGPANVSAESGNGDSNGESSNLPTDGKANESIAEVIEKKLKKKTFRVPLKVAEKASGNGLSLSEGSLSDAKRKLEELNKKDADRRRTAELKNNLEGYIYSTREKIESSGEIEQILTNEDKQSFTAKLEEVQDWLYMDGEDASAGEFEERLNMLKSIGDPIFFRLDELTARPAAVELARRFSDVSETVRGWETNKSWIPRERIDEVLSQADKLRKWLDEKQAEQDKTPASSAPVFSSEEVYEKMANLQSKVASVNKIPKPKPKVEKPVKKEAESSSSSDTSEENSTKKEAPENTEGSTTNNDGAGSGHDEL
ncbi:heat shock 70 kDa protein 17 [Silene latifolia]|uniref:heat shock 70 kDa protein 17 n=1 Tax=Silene latifolia TaxID=37657 RepID=UPI003D7831B5